MRALASTTASSKHSVPLFASDGSDGDMVKTRTDSEPFV
jgi:hypothetical protein